LGGDEAEEEKLTIKKRLMIVMVREGGPSTSSFRATDANSWILRLRGG
jgi:hypothetical protein